MFPAPTETIFEHRASSAPPAGGLVTVIVTLFNYRRFIEKCLDSVAAQTHAQLELVVVDDASSDDSAEAARIWLERNQARFRRVALIRHLENQGLPQARNTAFAAAEAAYVFVLDADNLLFPRAVARLLETLQDAGAGAAYSQLEFFGAVSQLGYADVWDRRSFETSNYVDAMALVSKAAWAAVGGYRDLDFGWEDYELWCRFLEAGIEGVLVPEILCRYRVHQSSMLRTDTDLNTMRVAQRITALHPWLKLAAG